MARRLSESELKERSLNQRLRDIWELKRGGNYTTHNVVETWLNDPVVERALEEERLAWLRTAGVKRLQDIIKQYNKENIRQYELLDTTVELAADYVVPGAFDEKEMEGEPDYHVPRDLLTVDEHSRHVEMRLKQWREDGAVLGRETKLRELMQAVKALGHELVLDVLARLRHRT